MSNKTSSDLSENKDPSKLKQEIVLLDGRRMTFVCGDDIRLDDKDGSTHSIYLKNINSENLFHFSLFKVIIGTLSTHSITYNSAITLAFKKWLLHPDMATATILDVAHLNSLLKIPLVYMAFIIPALRRIQSQQLPGLSTDLLDFFDNGYKWEERGDGAYYALITNDPIRGALTNQELHNLHAALNKAYSLKSISQEIFTLCWFFIGTGVRSIQIVRMKICDVQIFDGPEGKEVTLRIPLAKGTQKNQHDYWMRRAPSGSCG